MSCRGVKGSKGVQGQRGKVEDIIWREVEEGRGGEEGNEHVPVPCREEGSNVLETAEEATTWTWANTRCYTAPTVGPY